MKEGKDLQTNLITYLEKTATKYPENLAFVDEFNKYTYKDINNISKMIANEIDKNVLDKNNAIAVFIDRNALCLCGFFGTLYSGNYYVPIDTKMPVIRMQKVVSNINPKVFLYLSQDEELIKRLNETSNTALINLNAIFEKYKQEKPEEVPIIKKETIDVDPAYAIFTSGSTGEPKGIVISHRSVIDFTEWMSDTFNFSSEDVMANQAPFYFDLSVKDIYTTIKNGATCYIIPKKILMFPAVLVDYLNEIKATSLIWATSCFNLVSNSKVFEKKSLNTVNKVILGGETLYGKHLNNWKKYNPEIQYVNLYGPTEVTVDCTYYIIDKEYSDEDVIPIGRACENKEVLILDDDLKQVEQGQIGQICVRGTGLAKGYINDKEKTDSVFVQNTKSNYPDLMYKTGDLGFINKDGLIVFSTRADGQIKHMGYRIELGEIERAINSIVDVENAVCFYDLEKDKIVCVYAGKKDKIALIDELQTIIPKYMLPNLIIKKEALPLNQNGKINRTLIKEEYYKGE